MKKQRKDHSVLLRIYNTDAQAAEFGINWESVDSVLDNLISECEEIRSAIRTEGPERVIEEVGDLIFGVASLCRYLHLDPDEVGQRGLQKISKRMNCMREIARDRGLDSLRGIERSELTRMWTEAKRLAASTMRNTP